MSKTTILEVYQDKKGHYRFRLLAKNGEPVCASEGYAKKAAAVSAAKKLAEWATGAVLITADKKADAASKTTGKQPGSVTGKKIANKAAKSKAVTKTATKKVVA
jgi:uncharacterized protein YegP (UPF0339 family)